MDTYIYYSGNNEYSQIDRKLVMNVEEARQQAQDENTEPEILAELANSEDIETRKCVASNPNTPTEALLKLGTEFPDEIIANPIFALLVLENPESRFIQLSLARSTKTSIATLEKLMKRKNIEILCDVANSIGISEAALEKLADFRHQDLGEDWRRKKVRCCVANHPKLTSSLIKKLSADRSIVRYNVICNHHISSSSREQIIQKHNLDLDEKIQLASKSNFPEVIKNLSLDSKVKVRRAVASNPNTKPTILEQLLRENHPSICKALLNNPSTPEKIKEIIYFIQGNLQDCNQLIEELAKSQYLYIRNLVAKNSQAPNDIVIELAQDSSPKIRKSILFRKNLNPEIIDKVLETTISKIIADTRNIKYSKENYILCLAARHKNSNDLIINKLLSLVECQSCENTSINFNKIKTTIANRNKI